MRGKLEGQVVGSVQLIPLHCSYFTCTFGVGEIPILLVSSGFSALRSHIRTSGKSKISFYEMEKSSLLHGAGPVVAKMIKGSLTLHPAV